MIIKKSAESIQPTQLSGWLWAFAAAQSLNQFIDTENETSPESEEFAKKPFF